MGIIWNRELKKLGIIFLIILTLGIGMVNFCVGMYARQAGREYNEMLAVLLGSVAEKYPEAVEDGMMKILTDKVNGQSGREILARYGVFEDSFLPVQKKQFSFLRLSFNILFLVLFLSCGLFFFHYLKRRQERISDLTAYMEDLNRDNYRLEIDDNLDDELSGLRNELYKLTVFLKEQAGRALQQKCALADSVANISHQLKTPLTSAIVLMDNLMENADMDETLQHKFMSEVTRQLTGMSWLVTAMLKLSRLDAGVVELEKERLNVRELAEEALGRLELLAEWQGVAFLLDIPEGMGIYADRRWTLEALMNIVKNAAEHSVSGSSVEVTGEENDVYTQIVVRDHGAGITAEEREKLFRRFYRGNSLREDSIGIGLALAKEIVDKQGGYILADSRQGEGTVFILRFLNG